MAFGDMGALFEEEAVFVPEFQYDAGFEVIDRVDGRHRRAQRDDRSESENTRDRVEVSKDLGYAKWLVLGLIFTSAFFWAAFGGRHDVVVLVDKECDGIPMPILIPRTSPTTLVPVKVALAELKQLVSNTSKLTKRRRKLHVYQHKVYKKAGGNRTLMAMRNLSTVHVISPEVGYYGSNSTFYTKGHRKLEKSAHKNRRMTMWNRSVYKRGMLEHANRLTKPIQHNYESSPSDYEVFHRITKTDQVIDELFRVYHERLMNELARGKTAMRGSVLIDRSFATRNNSRSTYSHYCPHSSPNTLRGGNLTTPWHPNFPLLEDYVLFPRATKPDSVIDKLFRIYHEQTVNDMESRQKAMVGSWTSPVPSGKKSSGSIRVMRKVAHKNTTHRHSRRFIMAMDHTKSSSLKIAGQVNILSQHQENKMERKVRTSWTQLDSLNSVGDSASPSMAKSRSTSLGSGMHKPQMELSSWKPLAPNTFDAFVEQHGSVLVHFYLCPHSGDPWCHVEFPSPQAWNIVTQQHPGAWTAQTALFDCSQHLRFCMSKGVASFPRTKWLQHSPSSTSPHISEMKLIPTPAKPRTMGKRHNTMRQIMNDRIPVRVM